MNLKLFILIDIIFLRNAAQCQVFVAFMNLPWCKSKECDYEFKIALLTKHVKARPYILPILLEDFAVYEQYPFIFNTIEVIFLITHRFGTVYGCLCSTQGIQVKPAELNDTLWNSVLAAIRMKVVHAIESKVPQLT